MNIFIMRNILFNSPMYKLLFRNLSYIKFSVIIITIFLNNIEPGHFYLYVHDVCSPFLELVTENLKNKLFRFKLLKHRRSKFRSMLLLNERLEYLIQNIFLLIKMRLMQRYVL